LAGNHVDPNANSADFTGVRVATGETFYVDITNTGPADGSQTAPFLSINAAISNTITGRNDMIRVQPGIYEERPTLKRGTRLIGEQGSYFTMIFGDTVEEHVLTLGEGCVVRGFTVGEGGDPAVSGTTAAVFVPENAAAEVTNCVLLLSDTGLHADADAAVTFVNNTAYGNDVYGVRGEAGATFTLLKNSIFSETSTAISADADAIQGGSYNCFFGNAADFEGPSASPTDIFQNPLLVDVSGLLPVEELNFHLLAESPCRNAGDPDPDFNDIDDSRNDMGADGGPEGVSDVLSPIAVAMAVPDSGAAPLDVDLDGSGSSDEWGIASYSWDFDNADGLQEDAVGAVIDVTYPSAGAFTATLTVQDNSGRTSQATVDINVTSGLDAPTASASAVPLAGPAPLNLQLLGEGSDPDGGDVTFAWSLDDVPGTDSPLQDPVVVFNRHFPYGCP